MRRRYPIVAALAAQGGALLVVGLLVYGADRFFQVRPPLLLAVAAHALLALALGVRFGLFRWWRLFHVAFLPGLIGLHLCALPGWAYLAAFLLVLLLNWNSFRHGVPLYLTGTAANHALARLLREQPAGFRFIDLGSGLAGTLCHLARVYPKSQFMGVETAPLSFALSWLRSLPRRNCRIRYRSLWSVALADYEVIYCFLSPLPMAALWAKVREERKPGAWLISNTFGIPGIVPDQEIPLADRRATRLLVWWR